MVFQNGMGVIFSVSYTQHEDKKYFLFVLFCVVLFWWGGLVRVFLFICLLGGGGL